MSPGQEQLGWAPRVMEVLGVLTRLLAVQALWVLGAAAGALVLGVLPASVAAARVLRDAPRGLWRGFWGTWWAELRRAHLVAGLPLLLALAAVLNLLLVVPLVTGPAGPVLLVATTVFGVAGLLSTVCAVVVAARIPDAGAVAALRLAVLMPWISPGKALLLGVICTAAVLLAVTAPPVALLLGLSATLMVSTAVLEPVLEPVLESVLDPASGLPPGTESASAQDDEQIPLRSSPRRVSLRAPAPV